MYDVNREEKVGELQVGENRLWENGPAKAEELVFVE